MEDQVVWRCLICDFRAKNENEKAMHIEETGHDAGTDNASDELDPEKIGWEEELEKALTMDPTDPEDYEEEEKE